MDELEPEEDGSYRFDGFEAFTKPNTRNAPRVSIRRTGQIGFSQGAVARYNLDNGDWFVVCYYSKDKNSIGLLPTRDKEHVGAVPLYIRKGSTDGNMNAHIAAKSFLDYYDINYSKGRSYAPERDSKTGFITINLGDKNASEEEESEQGDDSIADTKAPE
jgi:hypothetical protein